MTYTKQQMLSYARARLGLDHLRSDCSAEQTDGIDADSLIEAALRQWYLELLAHGEPEHVSARAVEATASVPSGSSGADQYRLPGCCVRLLSLRLNGWHHAVAPLPPEEMEATIRRQLNSYTAATVRNPVAVMTRDGNVMAWPGAGQYGPSEFRGAVDDGAALYTFEESALSTLDTYLSKLKITDYASF